ncbi:MAG: sensor histidine kinase [Limnothrix sp. RL_2_0]|nr:sensor histidine kinase [Limnothrix sp. RL_2_0]
MDLEAAAKIKQLEKENRILKKKLLRAEDTCVQLEETTQKKEALLRQFIRELQDSKTNLEEQKQLYTSLQKQSLELQTALKELRQTQTHLIQAEKMSSLGQLVAGIAHEINNPINFIYGNISYLKEYIQSLITFIRLFKQYYPEPIAELEEITEEVDLDFVQTDLPKVIDSINIGTNRIRNLVISLRNFSRMDEAEFKAVDIHEGLESTLLILQHRLKANNTMPEIGVVKHYGTLPLVDCFPAQLNQVFMNILANAIDALEDATNHRQSVNNKELPKISITTTHPELNWVKISIHDNGLGIPNAIQEKILDPFFTTKEIGKGTGIGMSISHQILVEKHGGKLDFNSSTDKGTEFILQIPIKQQSSLGV